MVPKRNALVAFQVLSAIHVLLEPSSTISAQECANHAPINPKILTTLKMQQALLNAPMNVIQILSLSL